MKTLREQLAAIEQVATTPIVRCASYRRRNVFIDEDGHCYVLINDREFDYFGSLDGAARAIDRNPVKYPFQSLAREVR